HHATTTPLEPARPPTLPVDPDARLLESMAREAVESRLREGYGDPGDPDLLTLAARGYGPPELLEELLTLCAARVYGLPQLLEALLALAAAGLPLGALKEDPFGDAAVAALGRRLATAAT